MAHDVNDLVVCDFETLPIIEGSGLKPKPVGVSILVPGKDNIYLGWGHPGSNPHTYEFARAYLSRYWEKPLLFHNCKFDIGVAIEHMGLPWPDVYEDTLFQTYLVDPLAKSLALKPLAAKLLGMDPEEKDAVFRWLKENFKGPFLPDHKIITEANAGAYIGYAPYEVVAPYAMGDTDRTRGLHALLRPKVTKMGMDAAYARELKIAKIGYKMERVGVRVDRPALLRDQRKYLRLQAGQDDIIHSYLGDEVDIDSRQQVARAIIDKGYAFGLPKTPTGRLSTSKLSIEANVNEPTLLKALRYRATLQTLNGTFFRGWAHNSERDGHVHPSWNQVKSEKGGARTGRFSCSDPNLTNVPTEFDDDVLADVDLPYMRQYLLPDEGHVIVPADYNGQEMRIMAHYAEGRALEIYRDDPTADFHAVASALIKQYAGLVVPRKMCKIVGFSLIYGSGVATLAAQLGVTLEKAQAIKRAYFKAIPGLQEFIWLFRDRQQVKTWGGRILPCEAPHIVDGEWRTFNYKLCNYLIQGSAADQSKEAMIRYDEACDHGRLLMMVHDELVISTPKVWLPPEQAILRDSMEGMPGWDVPFKAEVEWGGNWHDLQPY